MRLEPFGSCRQVIVFTHNDRLPEACRRLQVEANMIEGTRAAAYAWPSLRTSLSFEFLGDCSGHRKCGESGRSRTPHKNRRWIRRTAGIRVLDQVVGGPHSQGLD